MPERIKVKKTLYCFIYALSCCGIAVSVLHFMHWKLINGAILLLASILMMPHILLPIARKTYRFRWQFVTVVFGLLLIGTIDFPATPIHWGPGGDKEGGADLTSFPEQFLTGSPTNAVSLTPTLCIKEEPFLIVTCLDVGQGDATLFRFHDVDGRDHYMMIDGGDRATSSFVVARLKKLGVEKLDVIVSTHYDADHAYGLIGCLEALSDAHTLVYCADYVADTYTYKSFIAHLKDGGYRVVHPLAGDGIPFGDCRLTVVGPSRQSEIENNNSIAVLLEYQGLSFLFTGDAEREEESDMLALIRNTCPISVYHAGHHGSYSASSDAFLDVVKPSITVISVGENDYGHPHNVTLNRLKQHQTQIYRTDERGEVTFVVDGSGLSVFCEK